MKTREELTTELVNLENRERELTRQKKNSAKDFKDLLGDVRDQIDQVLAEINELDN